MEQVYRSSCFILVFLSIVPGKTIFCLSDFESRESAIYVFSLPVSAESTHTHTPYVAGINGVELKVKRDRTEVATYFLATTINFVALLR